MGSTAIAFLGTTELIIILVMVVLVFGVGKLPEVGRQLGSGIKNFKKEMDTIEKAGELDGSAHEQETAPRDVTKEHGNA